jgi:lipoyl(octanoyl) transferase
MDMAEPVTKRMHLSEAAKVHTSATSPEVQVRRLGHVDYTATWEEMKRFTAERTTGDADQIWLLQHPPVYTLGLAARKAHLPRSDTRIQIIKTDRGGQITYHGPGQIVAYTLIDLRRLGIGVRQLVRRLEQSVIDLLAQYGVKADGREKAPGVYVGDDKVAALGLRIRNGCSYHGLSLNVEMDLAPFADIDPCGFPGLRVTQLRDLGIRDDMNVLSEKLLASLQSNLWPNHPNMETPDTGNR